MKDTKQSYIGPYYGETTNRKNLKEKISRTGKCCYKGGTHQKRKRYNPIQADGFESLFESSATGTGI